MTPLRLSIAAISALILAALIQLLPVMQVAQSSPPEPVADATPAPIEAVRFTGAPMFRPAQATESEPEPAPVETPQPAPPVLVGTIGEDIALVEFENRIQQLSVGASIGCWRLDSLSELTARFQCGDRQLAQRLYAQPND